MDDTKLLELAGRAAGEQYDAANNPLERDDLALRLAVKLEIEVRNFNGASHAGKQDLFWHTENWFPDGDPYAATRRCVTRAAAEIARAADAGGKD